MTTAVETTRAKEPPVEAAMKTYREILVFPEITNQNKPEAVALIADLKSRVKDIEAWFKPLLLDAKAVVDVAKVAVDGLKKKQADATSDLISGYTDLQKLLNNFLTADRLRVQAEELKLREDAARKKKEEEDELLASAKVLEDLGQTTAAASLRQEAERVIEAPVFSQTIDRTVRVDGGRAAGGATMSAAVETKAQVVDMKVFVKYLAEKGSACTFLEAKPAKLVAWVKANGLKAGDVPGLAIEETVSSRI